MIFTRTNTATFLVILCLLIIGGAVIFMVSSGRGKTVSVVDKPCLREEDTATMEMSEEAFTPQDLSIKRCTKVTFKNVGQKEHWPASDLHPTHTIYPEFDPQQPVESGAEWSFVFNRIGAWSYHDHLWPATRGIITVK